MIFFGSFFFKCLGSPCYLMVVSGGSFFSGGWHKDTSRCFLWCLQVLFNNIEFLLAVIITSFSVRHRLHARPPLENAWPLALIDQFTKWRVFFSFNFQMYEDNVVWHFGMILKDDFCVLHLFFNSFSVNPISAYDDVMLFATKKKFIMG